MKGINRIVLSVLLLAGLSSFAVAQQKIGHIDTGVLIKAMPETKKAEATLQAFGQTLQTEFEKMAKEHTDRLQKYQNEAGQMSDAINQTRMQEMQQSEKRLNDYRESAAQELDKKQMDVMGPILKKAQDAIDAVAKEKGLAYVLDTSKDMGISVVIYDAGGIDILPDVKKKLGIL